MAGAEVRGVEIMPDACETHRRNVGPCDQADMRAYHPRELFDIVIGGAPCQPFSEQGSRKGLNDPRGDLYLHLLRIAVEARASACVLENVRGLLLWRDPVTGVFAIDVVVAAFRDHGFPYVVHNVLNAQDYGVPQSRRRLFVIGFVDKAAYDRFRWPAPTHGEDFWLKPFVTVRQALGLTGKYETDAGGRTSFWQGDRSIDVDKPSYTIGTRNNADKLHRAGEEKRVRLSVEQLAVLQGFPSWFKFVGKKQGSLHLQAGNAVPPVLGAAVVGAVMRALVP